MMIRKFCHRFPLIRIKNTSGSVIYYIWANPTSPHYGCRATLTFFFTVETCHSSFIITAGLYMYTNKIGRYIIYNIPTYLKHYLHMKMLNYIL